MKQVQMLPIIIAGLCERFNISFGIGGNRAYTNWSHIQLPALPMDDAEVRKLALGYTIHEIGHILFTDKGVWDEWVASAGGLEKGVVNILEDVRMEAKLPTRYPGSKSSLKDLADKLVLDGEFEPTQESMPPQVLMSAFMLYRLRADVLGHNLDELGKMAQDHLEKAIPKGAMTRLQAMMYEIEEAESVADSINLARKIIKMLEDEQEKEEQQQQQQQEQQQQDQSSCQGSDDGDQPQSASGEGDSQESSGQGAGQADEDGNGSGAKALADILASDGDGMMDLDKTLEAMLEQSSDSMPAGTSVDMPQTYRYDFKATVPMNSTGVKQQTAELRRRLTELLRAQARSKRKFVTEGHRLARNRLARIAVGDPAVFERRKKGFVPDASVMLLIDRSGSMTTEIGLAIEAAAAAGLALEKVNGVKSAISAFPYGNSVGLLKDFGESVNKAMDVFPLVTANGSTPLAEAMLWSGWKLMSQKTQRKVLFVLTDGDPNNRVSATLMTDMLQKHGIEIMGIGINHTINLFKEQRRIDNIKDLPSAVFEMLEDAMLLVA